MPSATSSTASGVRFALGDYDRSRPLVIDPVSSTRTYIGVARTSTAIAVDAAGNAYIAGGATDGPTSPGRRPARADRPGRRRSHRRRLRREAQSGRHGARYSTYLGGEQDHDEATGSRSTRAGAASSPASPASATLPAGVPTLDTHAGSATRSPLEAGPGRERARVVDAASVAPRGGRAYRDRDRLARRVRRRLHQTRASGPTTASRLVNGDRGTRDRRTRFLTKLSLRRTDTLSMPYSTFIGAATGTPRSGEQATRIAVRDRHERARAPRHPPSPSRFRHGGPEPNRPRGRRVPGPLRHRRRPPRPLSSPRGFLGGAATDRGNAIALSHRGSQPGSWSRGDTAVDRLPGCPGSRNEPRRRRRGLRRRAAGDNGALAAMSLLRRRRNDARSTSPGGHRHERVDGAALRPRRRPLGATARTRSQPDPAGGDQPLPGQGHARLGRLRRRSSGPTWGGGDAGPRGARRRPQGYSAFVAA